MISDKPAQTRWWTCLWPVCVWRTSRLHDVIMPVVQILLVAVVLRYLGFVWWASLVFACGTALVLFNAMVFIDFLFRMRKGRGEK